MPACGTTTVYDEIYARTDLTDEERALLIEAQQIKDRAYSKLLQASQTKGDDTTIVVPVVFHIVHEYGPENIPNKTIYATLALLNREYNKQNPGISTVVNPFKELIGNVKLEFRLATIDPDGQCTSGIVRYVDPMANCKTIECNKALKAKYIWPRENYMNCFSVGSIQTSGGGTVQGFSHFPYSPYSLADSIDANAMIYSVLPTDMNDAGGRNTSVTSHEVGHWLGLYHTWGKTDNVALPENCNDDDEVGDTPNCQGLQSVCDLSANTCGAGTPGDTIDNAQNYMDYSHCYAMFTHGQASRMRSVLQNLPHRKTVCSPENLIATGTNYTERPTNVCKADFMANIDLTKFVVCPGQTITFSDLSFHQVKQRSWTFEGANPGIASDSVVQVSYSQPGTYSVTLQVWDEVNSVITTKENIVTVIAAEALGTSYSQNFEAIDLNQSNHFEIVNPDNNQTFELCEQAGLSGTKAAMIKNNLVVVKGQVDELVSNTLNLSGQGALTLDFNYAFTGKPGLASNDELNVWISSDCGHNWSRRKIIKGSTLKTASDSEIDFYPSGANEWKHASVNLNSFNKTNVRFKFEWISGGGNNVFIDDINLSSSTSVNELSLLQQSIEVSPNPSNGEFVVAFDLASSSNFQLSLYDITGKLAHVQNLENTIVGNNQVALNLAKLKPGLYQLNLSNPTTGTVTRKIVIQ